ncbi:hypothetical protein S245_033214, partial [Arachis hypogaea]
DGVSLSFFSSLNNFQSTSLYGIYSASMHPACSPLWNLCASTSVLKKKQQPFLRKFLSQNNSSSS